MKTRLAILTGLIMLTIMALAPISYAEVLSAHSDPTTNYITYMPTYNPLAGIVGAATGQATATGNLIYGGGLLQTNTEVFICYWGWTSDPSGEQPYYQGFLGNVGGSSWLGNDNQYNVNNPTGILKGTWSDSSSVPSKPSQTQVNNEGIKCEQHFGYSSQADYVVATPSGHSQSGFGTRWCAYHEGLSSGGNNVAVTYFPYITDAGTSCGKDFVNSGSAGALDGVSIVGGHEMAETQTDPAPCSGWCDSSGSEIGDKCAWSSNSGDITLGGKVYAVQPLWSNAISGCPVV